MFIGGFGSWHFPKAEEDDTHPHTNCTVCKGEKVIEALANKTKFVEACLDIWAKTRSFQDLFDKLEAIGYSITKAADVGK